MKEEFLTEYVNIRATALAEFWGDKYSDSIYLWESAKHNLPLEEIENNVVPTYEDLYSLQPEIEKRHEFCKSFYYKMLPILTERLNKIHGLDLSVTFWQISFARWLYRHIASAYEKYEYLGKFDINNTSIKLLDKNDFYVPNNHYDYVLCFSRDFGVQQLVSLYYYLYADKQFQVVNRKFPVVPIDFCNIPKQNENSTKEIAFMGVYLAPSIYQSLYQKSNGLIGNISLPVSDNIRNETNHSLRNYISGNNTKKNFESYFFQTLRYSMPKDYIENFRYYYDSFQKDIQSKSFNYIVSESWISQIPSAIYAAVAKENNRKFICFEHGSGSVFYKNWPSFMDHDVADYFVSVGWNNSDSNFVKGGFAVRDIIPHIFDNNKKRILYISRTKFIYWMEFNEACAGNSKFVKELRLIIDFINSLSPKIKENFMFRPRDKDVFFWDTELTLGLDKKNVVVDKSEDFAQSVAQSRVVIIDHMFTGFAELLLMNIPFMLLHDIHSIPLPEGLIPIFDELVQCGVVHTNAKSAAEQLDSVYDNVEEWWMSEKVQSALKKLINYSLAPSSNVTDFFMSLLDKNKLIASESNLNNSSYMRSLGVINQLEIERERLEKEIETNIQITLKEINNLIENSQAAKAKEVINKILKHKPNHFMALIYLAVVNVYEKNYFKAELILNSLLESENNSSTVMENLAWIANLKKELSVETGNFFEVNKKIILTDELIYSGKLTEAEDLLNQVLNEDSKSIDALNNFMVVKILQNNFHEAKDILFHILKIDDNNARTLENMKYMVEVMGSSYRSVVSNE